jgi:cytochrome c oxidase cbb3-type subunit 4
MTYETMRHAADTWGLLFLATLFLIAIWRAVRPSARAHHEAAKLIPFSDESPRHD